MNHNIWQHYKKTIIYKEECINENAIAKLGKLIVSECI